MSWWGCPCGHEGPPAPCQALASLTHSRSYASYGAGPRDVAGNGGGLSGGGSLGSGRLLLHLPVALPQVKDLGMSEEEP